MFSSTCYVFIYWNYETCFSCFPNDTSRSFCSVGSYNSRRKAFARSVDFSFIISGSERTYIFRVLLNVLPTPAILVLILETL